MPGQTGAAALFSPLKLGRNEIPTARKRSTLTSGIGVDVPGAGFRCVSRQAVRLGLAVLIGGLFGLLPGCGGKSSGGSGSTGTQTPTAATPTFSPAAGTYSSAQSVTISDATPNATIYYTTDGSTPTASSTKYAGAISVSSTETISAIAVASGYTNSAVASANYTITLPAATPTISPAGGTYTSPQAVTISDATPNVTIYYTTDGSTPTANSTKYTGAIAVSSTETISAIAAASGYANSAVASATYTINLPTAATPTFSLTGGTYASAQSVTISDTTPDSTIYYTTDGSNPTTSSNAYSGAITVSASETINAIAVASGYKNSAVATASYVIALADPETDMFFPIDFAKNSIGTAITTTPLGVVQGAKAQPGPMGVSPVQLLNPDRSDGLWDNPQAVVGSLRPVAAANAASVADTFFVVNLTAQFARVYSFQKDIANINPANNTISVGFQLNPAAQAANSVSTPQPFAFNSDGTAPTVLLIDTGSGVVVAAATGSAAYYLPRTGATLNAGYALTPATPHSGNVVAVQVDDKTGNFALVTGGTNPRFDMYDKTGNWLLSGPAGLVLPNSLQGTAASVITAGVDVAGSITVSPALNQNLSLYFAQQAAASGTGANTTNIGSLYVQPAAAGSQPSVTPGTVSNPTGAVFGPNIVFMSGMPLTSGSAAQLYVVDANASMLWSFSMTPVASGNAQALQSTETGSVVLPINSGVSIAQSPGLIAVTSNTVGVQTDIYIIPKLAGGSLGAAAPAGNSSVGSGGTLILGSANDNSRNFFFIAPNNGGSTMISGVDGDVWGANVISNPDPNGGAATTAINPLIGYSVNIGN